METTGGGKGSIGITTLLVASIAVSGCRTVVRMNPGEIYKLDGFRYGDTAFLSFHGSKSLPFTSKVPLTIVHTSGRGFTRRYVYIEVDEMYFWGKTLRGEKLRLPLDEIRELRVARRSKGKTLGLIGTVVSLVTVIPALVVIVILICSYREYQSEREEEEDWD